MNEPSSRVQTVSGALRHRAPVLLGVLLVCLLVGLGIVAFLPRTYQAEAILLVDARWAGAQDPNSALLASDTLTRLYIAEAMSRPLFQQVISQNHLPETPDSLSKAVTASTVRGTTLLAIDAKSGSPSEATTIANDVAQAVVDRNRNEVTARFESTKAYLQSELSRLDTAIKAVESEKPTSNAATTADHAARLTLLQNQYAGVYTQLRDTSLAEQRGISTLSVSALAAPPTRPISPDPLRYMVAALAIGVILGILAALLAERLDDRIYTPESMAAAAGTPVAVVVPPGFSEDGNAGAMTAYSLALASLRARHPGVRAVMVAAASAGDRADLPATGIGKAAAHDGQRVIIVRADSDRTGVPFAPSSNGVTIVPLPRSADPRLALGALTEGSGPYDFTVLSVPSPSSSPAAISFSGTAKLAILVATAKRTHHAEVRVAAEALRLAGVDVAASMLIPHQTRISEDLPGKR